MLYLGLFLKIPKLRSTSTRLMLYLKRATQMILIMRGMIVQKVKMNLMKSLHVKKEILMNIQKLCPLMISGDYRKIFSFSNKVSNKGKFNN